MMRPLPPTPERTRIVVAVGALFVLLARPRIPFVLTTAELGAESLVPSTLYYTLIVLLSLYFVYVGLRRFLRDNIISTFWPPLIILAVSMTSVFWSISPGASVRHWVQLTAFTAIIMVASSLLNLKSLVIAIGGASLFLVVYSFGYIAFVPDWGVLDTYVGPRWRGAFANQNSFGRWASLLFILSVGLLVHSRRRVLSLGSAAVALFAIIQTGSAQALGISLGIATLLVTIELVRRSRRRESVVGLIASVVGLLGTGALLVVRVDLATLLEEILSGREGLWFAIFPAVMERPFLGYGIGGFWSSGLADEVRREATFPASHAHNTYLDAALQLGVPFAFLFLLGVLVFLAASVRAVVRDRECWPFLALGAFIAVYSLSASMFFTGSFEWWCLFVALTGHLCAPSGPRKQPTHSSKLRLPDSPSSGTILRTAHSVSARRDLVK